MRKQTFLTLLPFSIALAFSACCDDSTDPPPTDPEVEILCDKKDIADCDAGTNDQ